MDKLMDINRYILERVKSQEFDKQMALSVLKLLNQKEEKKKEDIAIIGMACRFPDANTPEEFWNLLANGKNCIKPFPENRLKDALMAFPEDHQVKFFQGGFLEEIDKFDAEYFNIPPKVAEAMDPYQRLFLETVVETIHDAGINIKDFYGSNTGVFVGTDHTHKFRASYLSLLGAADFTGMTGSWAGILSSRASYIYNLKGPGMVIDTACSSGLSAINVACNAIFQGDCDQAIVGSANLFVLPTTDDGQMSLDDIEASDVKVRAFDKDASGTTWGEGVGCILIKPLSKAIKDGDPIHAVIKSALVNNDGASNGITAPNAVAQTDLIQKAWKEAGVTAEDITYIEAHGTGTKLGDPIEIKGLNSVFSKQTQRKQFCGIGSVKTNVGHAVGSAALISLIKVIMSLKKKKIAPSINFDEPNPFIDFTQSALYLNSRLNDWEVEDQKTRIAGINAFSFNGTNCHLVVAEAPNTPTEESINIPDQHLFTLSARNQDLLHETIQKYISYLTTEENIDQKIEAICFTNNISRENHAFRVAIITESKKELIAQLKQLHSVLQSDPASKIYFADCSSLLTDKKAQKTLQDKFNNILLSNNKDLETWAFHYLEGGPFAWEKYYGDTKYKKIHLPVPPFKKVRFWPQVKPLFGSSATSTNTQKSRKTITLAAPEGQATPTHHFAAQVWGNALGYDEIKISDNFYELGGDSVIAMQIISVINGELNLDLPISELLGNADFNTFVSKIESQHTSNQATVAIVEKGTSSFRCSSGQSRMFLLWKMNPDSLIYNIAGTVVLQNRLEEKVLQNCLHKLAQRHESLRTIFKMEDTPVQIVLPEIEIPIKVIDKSNENGNIDDLRVNAWMQEEIKPFDLEKGPLLQVCLFQIPGSKSALMLNFHHIISDGTSMGIFVKELGEMLSGNTLHPVTHQYIDYSSWQISALDSGHFDKHQKYWKEEFSGELPALTIPSEKKRPEVQTFKGKRYTESWSEDILRDLKKSARESDVTLFMYLLSGLNILLSKYSGQEDIVIGIPIVARSKKEFYPILGMFVNTLAIRSLPKADMSCKKYLETLKNKVLKAYDHQDYPYDQLIEDLNIKRDLSRNPLFDVMFELQNEDIGVNRLDDNIRFHEYVSDTAKFDFSFLAKETNKGLTLSLEYNSDLYSENLAKQLFRHFKSILSKIQIDKEQLIADLDFLPEADKFELLTTLNQTKVPYPQEASLIELFDEQVQKHRNSLILSNDEVRLTYGEFDKTVNQFANWLGDKGVKKGDHVGLLTDRSVEAIIIAFALLKIGAVYVPLDPEVPEDRIQYLVQDSKVVLVCALEELAGKTSEIIPTYIVKVNQTELDYPETFEAAKISPKHPVYIMYTSGSTGQPKGVLVCNQNVVRLVKNTNFVPMTAEMRLVQTGAPAFDAITFEWFGPMLNGGSIHIIDKETLLDLHKLKAVIITEKVNTLWLTTPLFHQIVDFDIQIFAPLDHLLIGGEVLSLKHCNRFKATLPTVNLINFYGPTESTTFSHYFPILHSFEENVPIGFPIHNTTSFVLDKKHNLVPKGVIGEICLGGDGVSLGYWNNPEVTHQKFVPNPFGEGLLYKSGDLGRILPDGALEFSGRSDFQVKIRGFRVELSEIEQFVLSNPKVVEAHIGTKINSDGQKQVVAYYTCEPGVTLAAMELKKFIEERLPFYMVPMYYLQLDAMPLNVNGKLDRKKFPEPQLIQNEYVAPQNELQELLLKAWQIVLSETKNISITDNFFEIGGQSLKAMRLSALLKEQHQIDLSLTEQFNHPTIIEQSKLLENRKGSGLTLPSLLPASIKDEYPVSSAQKRLFALQKMTPDSIAYNMPGAFLLQESIDQPTVYRILEVLLARHEALRTNFKLKDGAPVQIANPKVIPYLVEYTVQSIDELNKKFHDFVTAFDLENDLLFRVAIVRFPQNLFASQKAKMLIIFDMHHIVSDGVSVGQIIKDWKQIHGGHDLEKLDIQYKDYAVWEQEFRSSEIFLKQKAFWLEKMHGELPILSMPYDFKRPVIQSFKGDECRHMIDAKLSNQLLSIAKSKGLTLQIVLLGLYKILLSKYTDQEDIIVGVPVAGRALDGVAHTVGMFVNTLAMRSQPRFDKSIDGYLQELKNTCIEAYENQLYPFDELVDNLKLERDTSRNPIFDTMFIVQENISSENDQYKFKTHIAKFDLLMQAWQQDGSITIDAEYCKELFTENTIKTFLARFELLISIYCENPNLSLNQISLCTTAEKTRILNEFNDTKKEYPAHSNIVAQFKQWAKQSPDKPALEFGKVNISYQDLDAQSNALARHLLDQGVTRGSRVGLFMDRSTALIMAQLAILKAGACFVPIGINYPMDRVKYIEQNSELKLVVSNQVLPDGLFSCTTIFMEDIDTANSSTLEIDVTHLPSDLAYIMYTSGSTGNPKGVMVTHQNVIRLVKDTNFVPLDKTTQMLLTGAPVFDATTFEIWGAILNGGTLHLVNDEALLEPKSLKKAIQEGGINTMWLTAPLFNQLVDQDLHIFESLKYLVVGGDILSPEHIYKVLGKFPSLQIINGYGPTENVTFSTTFNIPKDHEYSRIPIGKPINNSTAYVVDRNGQLQANGLVGELWVGGDGVAAGYLNAPDLTQEKFIPNPFGAGMLYKTGDLARFLDSGDIDFFGRKDFQVKIRGYRIELGEIEYALCKNADILKCIVIPVEISGNKSLCAYFEASKALNTLEIKQSLGQYLPDYMIPSYLVQVAQMPLTTNGKIDRALLPLPEAVREHFEAPATETEKIIAKVWEEIIGIDQVSRLDNFFSLGGDSIKAIQVSSKLRSSKIMLEVNQMFRFPVLKELALHAKQVRIIAEQGEVTGTAPLTPIQRWYSTLNLPQAQHFHQGVIISRDKGFNIKILDYTMSQLASHHDALRIVIDQDSLNNRGIADGASYQIEEMSFEHTEIDDALVEQKIESMQKSTHLQRGPLVQLLVVHTKERGYLWWAIHHLVIDGISWRILIEDFQGIYDAYESGDEYAIPHKTSSFIDWSRELTMLANDAKFKKELTYWSQYRSLSKNQIFNKEEKSKEGHFVVQKKLSKALTSNLLTKANHAYGTDVKDLLLAALAMSIKSTRGQDQILVSMEGHGREEIKDELNVTRTVGWFTSMYPGLIVCEDARDAASSIKKTKDSLHKIPMRGIGYGILKYLNTDLDTSAIQDIEPEISFNYLGQFDAGSMDTSRWIVEPIPASISVAKENKRNFALDINTWVINDELEINFEYSKEAFKNDVDQIVAEYLDHLADIIQHCTSKEQKEITLSDLSSSDIEESEFDDILDDLKMN